MAIKKTFPFSLLFFALTGQPFIEVAATTYPWTGSSSSSGSPSNMSNAANWTGGVVPPINGGNDTLLLFQDTVNQAVNFFPNNDISNVQIGAMQIGALTFNSSTSYTVSGNMFSFLPGAASNTITCNFGSHTISAPLIISSTGYITLNSSVNGVLSLQGVLSGTGNTSVVIGSGTVLFGNVNSYAGNTTVSRGATLQVNLANSLPTAVELNGTLNFTNSSNESFSQFISGNLSAAGDKGILMSGSGNLTLTAVNSNYTGPVTISAGTLSIATSNNLGDGSATNILSMGPGTLQFSGNSLANNINLTGDGTISTTAGLPVNFSGIISEAVAGKGSLTIAGGAGTVSLNNSAGTNTYTGGTFLQTGSLALTQQANIGTGPVTIGGTTPTLSFLYSTSNFSLPISITSASTINLTGESVTLTKPLSGAGALTINGGTLTLSSIGGVSGYTGTTTMTSGSVVRGDTASLAGNYVLNTGTSLTFDQTVSGKQIADGTYRGIVTGSGAINKTGPGMVTLSGASGTFSGQTTIFAGTLNVTGALTGSSFDVTNSGSTLSGSGSLGALTVHNGGTIAPNSLQTLSISGSLAMESDSTYQVEIAPQAICDLLAITAIADLNNHPKLSIAPSDGFYGFGSNYTILKAATINGDFAPPTWTDSNFNITAAKSDDGKAINLTLFVLQPFLDFPSVNANIQSVANYLDLLGQEGILRSNGTLVNIINSLVGQSNEVINDALDQLHPAALSAFGEVQTDVGGHLISLFHRRPGAGPCDSTWRVWAKPYGNWLEEKNTGMQKGFLSQSYGGAVGIDGEILQNLVVGLGGAYNHSHLTWKNNRGHADSNGYYGAAYADLTYKFLYFGGALLAGVDQYNTHRHIEFTTIKETAAGKHDAFDLIAQFSTALFIGPSACCLAPYLNVDYFLLNQSGFTETGAPGLNLSIGSYSFQTIRSELGLGMQVKDTNWDKTLSLSPRMSLGWTMDLPIYRQSITSTLQGEKQSFTVKGWDRTWQLLSFTLGLDLSYKRFTFGGEYIGEITGNDRFWSQQANATFSWNW